jgi:hypothetical protein
MLVVGVGAVVLTVLNYILAAKTVRADLTVLKQHIGVNE